MNFTGVLANAMGIALGGILGTKFGSKVPDKVGETLMAGLALIVVFIGVDGVRLEGNILLAVVSIALGGVVGELIDFDARIARFGGRIQKRLSTEGNFGESMVNTTLLVCMGAVAIVGSIESGMQGNPDTLITKAVIDFVIVLVMASTMGIGCAFAALPTLFYEGGLTLLAGNLAPYLTESISTQMSFVGSILILGVGLNMLGLTRIKVGNLILAPFLPILFQRFY